MENKFMKFVNENKWFIVFYILWLFIHIIFVFNRNKYYDDQGFWPFQEFGGIKAYGFLELFVYLSLPIIVFIIIKLVGKDIKKAIDENN